MPHANQRMQAARGLLLFAGLLALGGCHVVYSKAPIGDQAAVLKPADWEGVWAHKDGAVTVMVANAEQGVLDLGWVEKKQERLVFEHYRVWMRNTGTTLFGSVQDPDKPSRYVWGRVHNEDNQIVVWIPDPAAFRSLVEHKVLRGTVSKNGEDILLERVDPAVWQRLVHGTPGLPLDWEHPIVLNRLSR